MLAVSTARLSAYPGNTSFMFTIVPGSVLSNMYHIIAGISNLRKQL